MTQAENRMTKSLMRNNSDSSDESAEDAKKLCFTYHALEKEKPALLILLT